MHTETAQPLPRFAPGTQFVKRGDKNQAIRTVKDVWTTKNQAGETVSIGYLCEHAFCGQTLTEVHVADSTIARGLLKNVPGPAGNPFSA